LKLDSSNDTQLTPERKWKDFKAAKSITSRHLSARKKGILLKIKPLKFWSIFMAA